jgi:hypothetical protein
VIFTSLRDDSVGAGKRPDGSPQTDTNNDGNATAAAPGDWRSIIIDQYAHDRNVDAVVEAEPAGGTSPGSNSTPAQAQQLGGLAPNEMNADENLRLGYVVYGLLNAPSDVDVYSFQGKAGTEIWLDIDQTSASLDAVLELVDANGVVLARSDNSYDEARNVTNLVGIGLKMQKTPPFEGTDYWSTNPKDPGMRLVLPGAPGTTNTYYVRVRSNSANLSDLSAGQTAGNYQLQIRLHERDEKAGTTIRYSNISYATNGIEVYGQPGHSPLTGEAGENLANNDTMGNATDLGNILNTDRMAMSIAGSAKTFKACRLTCNWPTSTSIALTCDTAARSRSAVSRLAASSR